MKVSGLFITLSGTYYIIERFRITLSGTYYSIGRLLHYRLVQMPCLIKAVAYTSLVPPILEYASAAWDPHSQNNIKTLGRIQRPAARFCSKSLFQGTRICNKTFTRTMMGNTSNEKKIQKNHHFI